MNQNSNKVKWYPRLFTDDMVRKILSDRKTATRWPLRKQPVEEVAKRVGEWVWEDVAGNVFHAPVRPGDVIWGRETWAHREGGPVYDAVGRVMDSFESETVYRASCPKGKGPWKPSIHMPRRYTRILLRVTGVKLVQVQESVRKRRRPKALHHPQSKLSSLAEGCSLSLPDRTSPASGTLFTPRAAWGGTRTRGSGQRRSGGSRRRRP